MELVEQRQNGVAIVEPCGRVDSTTSEVLERALERLVQGGERRVIVDLAGVEYMSSAGLRVLLVAAKRLGKTSLLLCSLTEPVRQVFDLAGFLPLFGIEPSRESALQRFAGIA